MAEEGKHVPLTIDNICKELQAEGVYTHIGGLGIWLCVPDHKLREIAQQHTTQANRTRATIAYWLSLDPTPSWRRVVLALEGSNKHKAAERVKPYVEPLTDPSLTAENVSSVLETVRHWRTVRDREAVRGWRTVSLVLGVPEEQIIETTFSTETARRQAVVDWWLRYSPTASWTWLAGRLYYFEERTALEAVSQYIHKETADRTLNVMNLESVLSGVTKWFEEVLYAVSLPAWLQIPESVWKEIQQQTSDATQQKKTLLERWLRDHPAPSWAVVAEALYQMKELGVLEQVKKMYITGSAKKIFEEAMRHGRVNSQMTKVLITGIAGSGKTCTKHVLIDEPPPTVRKSTPCAEPPLKLRLMKVGVRRREVKWERTGPTRLITYLAAAANLYTKLEARKAKAAQQSDDRHERTQSTAGRLQREARPDVANKKLVSEQESVSASSGPRADSFGSASPQSPDVQSALATSVTEEEIVRLIEQSVGSELLHEIEWVQFVDSGGQPQFLEVYPVFHRRTSVWVFVLKLSERLDEHPTVEYYDQDGKLVCKPYTAAHTTKQILLYSIRSLRSHGCVPKILIVGTHKDKEKECEESREAKNQKLREMLLPEFADQLIFRGEELDELIFPLNAQSPGEEEKMIAEEIRRVIMEQCSPQTDTLPLGWYALELKLKEIAEALGQQVISWKVCFEVAQRLHFDEQSFDAALSYLDELNIIYYYRGVLSEMIFCDTQVLLDKVTELVQMSYKLRNKPTRGGARAFGAEWRRFRDYGVVNSKFLQSNFKKHYVPGLFTSQELIKLFESLLILADFGEVGCYFMPCLLHRLTPAEVGEHRSSTSFFLHFPHGTRNGIFCSLIAFLISNNNCFPNAWKLAVRSRSTTPVCLSRNCVVFSVAGFPGRVTLIDSDSFYEVHISTRVEQPKLCQYVRDAMTTGLEKATVNLHYTNSRPVIAFPCPCSEGELHPATVGIDQTLWLCSIDDDMYGKLEEKQLRWIHSRPTSESAVCTTPVMTGATATAAAVYKVVEETRAVLESTTLKQKAEERLGDDDMVDIMGYLHTLDKHQLNHLGMVLGLSRHRLKGMLDTPTFLDDMISSWLQQADQVATKSGVPTWRSLVKALRHQLLGQNGIASQIVMDQLLE